MTCSMDSSQNTSQQETHRHRYEIRQKPFSFDDNFTIKNEVGQDVYKVRSKIFSFGDKLVLENMNGNALIKIQQESLHLHLTYNLLSAHDGDSDRLLAIVKKKLTILDEIFNIYSVYGKYTPKSSRSCVHSFKVMKDLRIVATVNRERFGLSDIYNVDLVDDEDQAFILALVIVLGRVLYDK
ncbi:unnamed protein product [Rotaria sp. Silwood2]|nr:unnamed protein product [Rotaria sp. Silwood2]CAF3367854.1 unnamed protein product [Rotaria sp. Silwood2]CAF4503354.1 unnamed protein product [Rotaria sp. Silwood2]CAF4510130.1 unnamed protein product [Rotaria sp. Silwood2]